MLNYNSEAKDEARTRPRRRAETNHFVSVAVGEGRRSVPAKMPTDHALFYASDILRQNRSAINNVKFDVHGRLMKAYKQEEVFVLQPPLQGQNASCELPSISSLLELEGDSEAIEDYLGENAPTLTTANLKAFVNKQMKSEKEASWTNMEGAQSVVHRGAGKKRKIA
ncbi:uncharacterized protein DS421_4g132510 [Arachis hypogaea]|nr:uncharacterized protein DS421_4g132510 [Arachis hypogaea]